MPKDHLESPPNLTSMSSDCGQQSTEAWGDKTKMLHERNWTQHFLAVKQQLQVMEWRLFGDSTGFQNLNKHPVKKKKSKDISNSRYPKQINCWKTGTEMLHMEQFTHRARAPRGHCRRMWKWTNMREDWHDWICRTNRCREKPTHIFTPVFVPFPFLLVSYLYGVSQISV